MSAFGGRADMNRTYARKILSRRVASVSAGDFGGARGRRWVLPTQLSPPAVGCCQTRSLTRHSSLEGRDRGHNLFRGNDGTGVVRHVDVESGAHHLVRIVRRRVFDNRHLVAELGSITNGRLD